MTIKIESNLMLDEMKVIKRPITPVKLRNICLKFSQGNSKIEDCLLPPKTPGGKKRLKLSFHTLASAVKKLCKMQGSIAPKIGIFLRQAISIVEIENLEKIDGYPMLNERLGYIGIEDGPIEEYVKKHGVPEHVPLNEIMMDKLKKTKRPITPTKLRNICIKFSQGDPRVDAWLSGRPSSQRLEFASEALCMKDSIAYEVGNFLHVAIPIRRKEKSDNDTEKAWISPKTCRLCHRLTNGSKLCSCHSRSGNEAGYKKGVRRFSIYVEEREKLRGSARTVPKHKNSFIKWMEQNTPHVYKEVGNVNLLDAIIYLDDKSPKFGPEKNLRLAEHKLMAGEESVNAKKMELISLINPNSNEHVMLPESEFKEHIKGYKKAGWLTLTQAEQYNRISAKFLLDAEAYLIAKSQLKRGGARRKGSSTAVSGKG